MNTWGRKLRVALLIAISLFASGCFKIESTTVIDPDGKVKIEERMLVAPGMEETLKQAKSNSDSSQETQTDVSADGMDGVKKVKEYGSIYEAASTNPGFYKIKGKNDGVRARKGLLYDYYTFDLFVEGNKQSSPSKPGSSDEEFEKMFLSSAKFDYVLTLSYKPDSSNADQIVDGNPKSLKWNLLPTITTGTDRHIQVAFRIWHKGTAAAIGVVFCLLLGGAVYVFIKKNKSDNLSQKRLLEKAFVGLLTATVLVGVASCYTVFVTPGLQLADTVSTSVDSVPKIVDEDAIRKANQKTAQQKQKPVVKHKLSYYVQKKDEFDRQISYLAQDINKYIGSHPNFRSAFDLKNRSQELQNKINETMNVLRQTQVPDKNQKDALIKLLTLESKRVSGLRLGMKESSAGRDFMPQFKMGADAADQFEKQNKEFIAKYGVK